MSRMILSGGFDPCHSGHIAMIRDACQRMDGGVIICLNSDQWLTRKKGRPFMNFEERKAIMENIKGVVCVLDMDDSDGTACDGIRKARALFPKEEMFFGNGGDRKAITTPTLEQNLCGKLNIKAVFGIGGDFKQNSSSVILSQWNKMTEERPWGEFTTYEVGNYIGGQYKVKTMTVMPRQRLSLQHHAHRNETWVVASGVAKVEVDYEPFTCVVGDVINIKAGSVHRVACGGDDPCVILELQWGEMCNENDITRLQDDYARTE